MIMIREVCSPLNKPRTPQASNPGKLLKTATAHAPVYGPPVSGARGDAQSLPPAISAALSTTLNGRDMTIPDPFPPPGRPK
jgi:hypothetical protein